jgi:hypothetical protein
MFLCCLFNDTANSTDFTVLNFSVINELERKRKEAITTQFVVSIHHFAEEN